MRAGQLDYPPSIEHPRHFPRGRRYPGALHRDYLRDLCSSPNISPWSLSARLDLRYLLRSGTEYCPGV